MSNDSFEISSDFFGGDTKSFHSLLASPGVSPFIPMRVITEVMRQAVDFDGKAGRSTEEVEDERSERMLLTEL